MKLEFSPSKPDVWLSNKEVLVSSIDVARKLEIKHAKILKIIEKIIEKDASYTKHFKKNVFPEESAFIIYNIDKYGTYLLTRIICKDKFKEIPIAYQMAFEEKALFLEELLSQS